MELRKITQLSWRRFLSTDEGKEGLLYLHENAPSVYKGQPHEIAFDAGFAQGYQRCLKQISELLAIEPPREIRADND